MAIGFNKIFLAGNLGSDPQSFDVKGGESKMVKLSLAQNSYRGKGEEHTNWFRVTVFGKQAEMCMKYLKKGSAVLVEGEAQVKKYTDKEGNVRDGFDIVVGYNGGIKFLPGGSGPKSAEENKATDNSDVPF